MDKLAMEEAGFRNCVSVPDGAPPVVSTKDLPPEEKVFFILKTLNYVIGVMHLWLLNIVMFLF